MRLLMTTLGVALYLLRLVHAEEPCRIQVVDAENGWPVPIVELKTTNQVRFYSDNAGVIAFDLPESMGVPTWFSIEGHGYGVAADGFGNAGVRLTPEPGKTLIVKVTRQLPAKRLGRITGVGIFGEAQRFGEFADWQDQRVSGCDSVQNAIHNGKLYWLWGDTKLPRYPLGLFHMIGGITGTQPLKSFQPPIKIRYQYFRGDDGRMRTVAKMPGSGPTWASGFVSLPDRYGKQRLVAAYQKIRPPVFPYRIGLCVWDETSDSFKPFKVVWEESAEAPEPPIAPEGHPIFWTDENDEEWVLFGDPFPRLKCAATFEAWSDPDKWQILKPQQQVQPRDGGEAVIPHRGSIAWNAFRNKWVTVFCQNGGSPSSLGELWYAEADTPLGPWGPAVKVVTHNNYTFYNPRLHPGFTPEGSPILLFEATYTTTFAEGAVPAPRHEYNQIMYRLDLDDPDLTLLE